MWPWQESNLHLRLRKPTYYPLYYAANKNKNGANVTTCPVLYTKLCSGLLQAHLPFKKAVALVADAVYILLAIFFEDDKASAITQVKVAAYQLAAIYLPHGHPCLWRIGFYRGFVFEEAAEQWETGGGGGEKGSSQGKCHPDTRAPDSEPGKCVDVSG